MTTTPPIAEIAPDGQELTAYDIRHLVTYLRLLDADEEGADWREVARIVLGLDPETDETRSKRTWVSHLARAQWMASEGSDLVVPLIKAVQQQQGQIDALKAANDNLKNANDELRARLDALEKK